MIEDLNYQQPDNEKLLLDLESLDLNTSELTNRLQLWGDYRKTSTINRAIQRIKSKEIPMSGEMYVIVKMLLERQRQMKDIYVDIKWTTQSNGVTSATIDEFKVELHPYKGGRWVVQVTEPTTGYCPPWPIFPKSLEEAKRKAIVIIEETKVRFLDWPD